MIDAARWAPTSGNRQPWRFLIITRREEKELLMKIKEEHCVTAPLLIFVGMDQRVYGALGKDERGIYIDAGAAAMQMVLLAHKCGLGVCWNHFADDLINSRKVNQDIYRRFARTMGIPEWIAPIAIVAIGIPEFLPPEPARMAVDGLMIRRPEPALEDAATTAGAASYASSGPR
jgi:nitroreductase